MKLFIKLIFVFSFFGFSNLSLSETYTFGIVPQQSASKLAKIWTPIFTHLTKETGDTYQFSTAKDIPTFEKRLSEGVYDIAYMNPYHFTIFNENPGYQSFLKQKNKLIQGIFVTNKENTISNINELNNKKIAFPSPAAFAASLILQSELNRLGVDYTPVYVSSHDSVYLNISNNNFLAGGGIKRTLNNTKAETKDNIKILWESPKYTPHAFAYHPSVSKENINKLTQAFLKMQNTDEGRALLKEINIPELEIAKNSDWDDIRALDIPLLKYYLKP